MIFTCRLSMYKLAGSFKPSCLLFLVGLLVSSISFAEREEINWSTFEAQMKASNEKDRKEGISYIISGSLGLVGGLLAQSSTSDPLEKGVFILSQSIGLAAIGFGAEKWMLGDEQRIIYETLKGTSSLTPLQKSELLQSYYARKKEREIRENKIKAVTFGIISLINIYGASQAQNEAVKNGLYFVGTVNALAAVSFTF